MPFITIKDRRLHYADTYVPKGHPSSPLKVTLILIHGLGSSQNFYFPILHCLSNYRCITLDTYGSARSSFAGHSQSLENLVRDVLGVLDALEVKQAVIVGHSMGGMVASALAVTAPERVLAVIGIGPITPGDNVAKVFDDRIGTVLKDGMEPLANSIPDSATGQQSTPLQRAFIRELLLTQNPKGYASLCQVIVDSQAPDYPAIRAPYLIIAGDEDHSAPLDRCKIIFDTVSSLTKKIKVLKGVGHWHCIEASEEVGMTIAEFCGSLDLGRTSRTSAD